MKTKIIKAITLSLVAVFAVLMIEPLRYFAGMAAIVVFGMLIADAWRGYRNGNFDDAGNRGYKKS